MLSFKDYCNGLYEERFDASHRDKLAKAKRGKRLSSATKDKISDTMKGTSNFAGKKHTKADKVKIQLSRGHDDRIDGRKWIVKKGDGNTYRKYSLPNRYDYQYGRRVRRNVNENHLHIFDIDDTLLHTTAKINVKDHTGKVVKTLSNQEFNDHKLEHGHSYDFSEFRSGDKFKKESKPIRPAIAKIKAIQKNIANKPGSKSKIIMNTARADFDDKDKVLGKFKSYGVNTDHIHIHRAGNIPGNEQPAQKKLVYIRKHLDTGNYKEAHMYDDSKTNLHAFKSLSNEYPHVKFHAYHAQPDGSMKKI